MYSKPFTLHIPSSLYEVLIVEAKRRGIPVSKTILVLIKQALGLGESVRPESPQRDVPTGIVESDIYTKRMVLDVPSDLHRRIRNESDRRGLPIKEVVFSLLDHALIDSEGAKPSSTLRESNVQAAMSESPDRDAETGKHDPTMQAAIDRVSRQFPDSIDRDIAPGRPESSNRDVETGNIIDVTYEPVEDERVELPPRVKSNPPDSSDRDESTGKYKDFSKLL